MDVLKAEIERKKRQLENHNLLQPNKKYFKRGDLIAKETEDYWKKHEQQKDNSAVNHNVEETTKEMKKAVVTEEEKFSQLPRKEVIRKLRERAEPILLFGETEFEVYQRLKKLEALVPEINKGFENDFKTAMDQVDQDYLNAIIKTSGADGTANDVSVKDDGTTLADIQSMKEEIAQGNEEKDQDIILRFLKLILKLWGDSLNNRPPDEKRTMRGKLSSATHSQTVTYMKPLFKKLKQRKLEEDLLEPLSEIIKYLMERDYLKASDTYLEMAIGNAPWPIGVTMVGIHARTGREKISSRYVAHVLNDETQRKYIQGLKRLMTQCQKFLSTDPSRSVDFEPIHS